MPKVFVNHKWELDLLPFRASMPSWDFWEKERLTAMYNAIRLGDTILDIGAEQGDLSVLFKKWSGNTGKIILVEPSRGFWPNIKATFEMNNERPFRCYQALVSNESSSLASNHGSVWPDAADGQVSSEVGFSHLNEKPDIPVLTIDEMDLPHVDVITMDIEGSEYEALQGAETTIKQDKPILFISIHPEFMWHEHHHTPDDLHVMLSNWGYDGTYLASDHEQHYLYKPRSL